MSLKAGGTKESGHEGRKRRRLEREQALAAQAERIAAGGDTPAHLKRFAALGRPPEKTEELLPWAAKVVAEALHQTVNDAAIDEDKRRKQTSELADKLGKLYPRATIEAMVKKLTGTRQPDKPDEKVTRLEGSGITRPATARQYQKPGETVPHE